MNILICSGRSEPFYTSSIALIDAFNDLGHTVYTAGPVYGVKDNSFIDRNEIYVPDKPYPETYTYAEILDLMPCTPDFILVIEPHFYFIGEKPKGIKSYYFVLDPHRGGLGHRDMALKGNYDAIFISQKYFANAYERKGLKTHFVMQAYNDDLIYPIDDIKPVCDIAFVGETGISKKDLFTYAKKDEEGFIYTTKLVDNIHLSSQNNEYAERAYLLKALIKEFNVRIYFDKLYGEDYIRILQKGQIGFNRSLFNDIAARNFEVIGCKRYLVTDVVPNLTIPQLSINYYKQYGYSPFNANFTLDAEEAISSVKDALTMHPSAQRLIIERNYHIIKKYHTFKARAKQIIEIITAGN